MSIGENVKALRTDRGLTQKELATKVNVAESMICRIERGGIQPSISLAKALAGALECELVDVVG